MGVGGAKSQDKKGQAGAWGSTAGREDAGGTQDGLDALVHLSAPRA